MKNILKHELSILIPTYNYICWNLVLCLNKQAELLSKATNGKFQYEIIVAEDGSTDIETIKANHQINKLGNCRQIIYQENRGRATIRNILAQQSIYEWLLFIDSDMIVDDKDYLLKYVSTISRNVIDGGIKIKRDDALLYNLRYMYEKSAESAHTTSKRRLAPYQHFHTANYLIRRDTMLQYPFDERFRKYGYEDILFGKTLQEHNISIDHIDNTLSFEIFETNRQFIEKTEEGLMTLYQFQQELEGYSNLLSFIHHIDNVGICNMVRWIHRSLGKQIRRILIGERPLLLLFKLYKIGFYLSINNK